MAHRRLLPAAAVGSLTLAAAVACGFVGHFGVRDVWPAPAGHFRELSCWCAGGRLIVYWSPAHPAVPVPVNGRSIPMTPAMGLGGSARFDLLASRGHQAIDGFDAHWLGPAGVGPYLLSVPIWAAELPLLILPLLSWRSRHRRRRADRAGFAVVPTPAGLD